MKKRKVQPKQTTKRKSPLARSHTVPTELGMNEQQFRLLVDSVEEYAIYMLDPIGNVITWNSGAERIKGYKASEIIGKNFACFYTPEDVAAGKPQRNLDSARKKG